MLWILSTTLPLCAEQLTPAEPEWPICFDEQAWGDLASQIDAELVRTAEEAVKAAVTPILAEKVAVVVERDEWRTVAETQTLRADKLQLRLSRRGLWTWGLALAVPAAAVTGYLVARLLPR